MKSFTMNEGSIDEFCKDLERLKSKFYGSERLLLDEDGNPFRLGEFKINKIYATEDFNRLFGRIFETFENIKKDLKKDEKIPSSKTS